MEQKLYIFFPLGTTALFFSFRNIAFCILKLNVLFKHYTMAQPKNV